MKKFIDLHLHLDGALTVEMAKKLADIQGIKLPSENDSELEKLLTVPNTCTSLNDFLKCFALPGFLMQTKESLCEAVRLVCENLKVQGVIYAEIRFAPQLHKEKGLTQEDAILAALEGLKKTDLKANLILCCMRGHGNDDENRETVLLAKKYLVQDGGIVAIDLAGAECLFPTSIYRDLFAFARNLGIPFTIHAGEADGAGSVKCAIEYGAVRIGHGVRAKEDPEVLKMISERGIFLEMCPTSNRQTKSVEDMSHYPFMEYLEAGIKVTLNTDDPGIEGTTIAKEFSYMEEIFNLTEQQEKILLNNSIEAAFTTVSVKQQLIEKLS